MKVKLKQHYQDAHIHLEPGQVYEGELSAYLLKHRMAEQVEEIPAQIGETSGNFGKLPEFDPTVERVAEPVADPAPEAPKRKRGKQ